MSTFPMTSRDGTERPIVPMRSDPSPQVDSRPPQARSTATMPVAVRAPADPSEPAVASERCRAAFYTVSSGAGGLDPSTERQVAACAEYANNMGMDLVEGGLFSEKALAGSSVTGRGRLVDLLVRVQAGGIHTIVIEDPSRLGRNMSDLDLVWFVRALEWMGVEVHAATCGRVDAARVSVGDFLHCQRIDALVRRADFGRRAMVRDARVPWGGRTFGYVRDGHVGGQVKIHQCEGKIVLDVFRMARAGESNVRIARILNDQHRLGRRAGPWTADAVRRMLGNRQYRGIIAYGRSRRRLDPMTLKVNVTAVSERDWEIGSVKHLAIVDDALWGDVQSRRRPPNDARSRLRGP